MKTSASKYLLIAAMGVMLTGCYDDDILSDAGGNIAGGGSPIVLSAAYPTLTRASDAGFEDGDNMGVYVLDYEGDAPQDISGFGLNANNVRFKFNATDNTWTGATDIYWKDNVTPADIIGYYPFLSTVENPKVLPFSITPRQDQMGDDVRMGGYEASDFLWAKAVKTMPSEQKVELTFTHLMAGMRVTLQEGSGFSQGEWSGLEKTVIVPNVASSATIDLENGDVAVAGTTKVSVVPYENNGEWRAVVVPQTLPAGSKVVSLNVGGASYSLTKDADLTLVSGKLHSFTITVNKKAAGGDYEFVLTDEAITVWIDDVEFRDGLMREYVTVEVDSRGTLQSCMEALGLNPAEVTNLKIKGELNEEDFRYIREKMDFIKALNLLDAEVYEGDKKGVIPENALRDKITLQRVVFPKHLTVIGTCAFAASGLVGDLIIPEGVTHVGTRSEFDSSPGHWDGTAGAFQDCNSLVGTLSLPSTLKFIETSAFRRTNLTGDLAFPDGVTFIGACAFDSSGFDGTMSLPENIEVIGPGAFFRCHVTGNLNIPQGITTIYESTFTDGNYQLITLPEGLRVVESHAFSGCGIRGELVIPSTCKRLEMYAFASNNISSIVFPKEMSFLGKGCFESNTRLSGTLTFPAGLSMVNEYCFNGCTMLDAVVLGEEVTQLGGGAFMNCYNLSSIVVNNPEPPLLNSTSWDWQVFEAFTGVPKDNFVIQVPGKSVEAYKSADGWREFKRISAYSNFVCRPAQTCALPSRHQESLVLNSDGKWSVTHQPSWCSLSRTSGTGKTEITLTINELSKGSGTRQDYIEFTLEGTEFTTRCEVRQYDYAYDEDQCIQLQRATKGSGIDILFVGDGWD